MKKKILLAIAFIALSGPIHSNAQIIRLFAGKIGTDIDCAGYPSDGGPALSGILCKPDAIAVTNTGIVYFSDFNGSVFRKIDASGIISTPTLSGATSSVGFDDMAVDGAGNVYGLARGTYSVSKTTPSGFCSVVAGIGSGSSTSTGDGGPATAADLGWASAIAVDVAGNIFIAESGLTTCKIRKVNTSGIISTYAGTGSIGYYGEGIAATSALFGDINAMAVDAAGNLYVNDRVTGSGVANRIRKISASGIVNTISGHGTIGFSGDGGPATAAEYNNVMQLECAGTDLYIADGGNNRIRRISNSGAGNVTTVVGNGSLAYSGDGAPATYAGGIGFFAKDMGVQSNGRIFLSNRGMNVMRSVDAPTGIDETAFATGTVSIQPNPAKGDFTVNLTVDANQATVKVVDILGRCISENEVATTPFEGATAPFTGIPTGVYSVIVITGKRVYTQKVVVN